MTPKRVVLFGTNRYAIAINDFFMFFDRSDHHVAHVFYPVGAHANRDWWETGVRADRARGDVVDPMTRYCGPITVWADLERDVFPTLDRGDFDHICVGNGNDPAHKALIARYGREKFLFSEYGWLPWSAHFYIAREGAGFDSDIARLTAADVARLNIDADGIAAFHESLDTGAPVGFDNFIYVPLQKDVNYFKFLFNEFKNNDAFLRFIDDVTPPGIILLIKRHPLYNKKYDISFSRRMIDISDMELNKRQLYQRMRAMICLNSTSILEALSFGGQVFSYGDDIFVGKEVTHHRVMARDAFAGLLGAPQDAEQQRRFVSLLFSRQVNRRRCVGGDLGYVRRHYWNLCL